MKKILEGLFFLLPIAVIGVLVYFGINASPSHDKPLKNQATPQPTTAQVNDQKFNYYSYKLSDLNMLKIINNSKKQESKSILLENNCEIGINGGFYDENNNPLGLLIIDQEILFPSKNSLLLDAYFWLSSLGGFGITRDLPEQELQLALQSGPLLIENGEANLLKINNDKQARRSVLASLGNGNLWLLIVFDVNSVFLGPKLADLPQVVLEIAQKENQVVIEALNLDGGTASMFKNSEVYLSEYKPVRTFFCVTKE